MKICNIDIKDYGNDVNGTYDYDSTLQIELYDFDTSKKENVSYSSEVEYREMIIKDYKNDTYIYSPYCKHIKKTYSRLYYENFVSDFFLMCSKPEAIDEFSKELKIKAIIFYHPLFIHLFNNVSLLKKENKRRRTFDLLKKPNKKIIKINENNIKKIEISSVISDYSYRNSRQSLSVESENYIKLYFNKAILIENILEYIKEFNVIINAYFPLGLKSNETYVVTQKGAFLKLTHKLLGDVKYYNKAVYFPIKLNFFEYLEKMYKTMNYRTIENKNFYLPLDFKRPITLEDQFLYYYRYIDMFFGYREKQKGNELRKTHKRIELFLKENLGLFQDVDCGDLELLKNKICSLRNHYLHEGYYLTNDEYTVNDGTKEFNVKLDYMWLYKITQSFKIGTYNILYKDILDVEINESELKICCNNIK